MRKRKIGLVTILLLLSIVLTGCNEWMNYIHTDAGLMRRGRRLLKEKYDEEFVIYDVWDEGQKSFFAVCSPKNNPEVVFEAKIRKDGSKIWWDEYVQEIVSKQIRERMGPELGELFGECFVYANVFYVETQFDDVKQVTVEEYIKQDTDAKCLINIFVKKTAIPSDREIKKEYDYFSKKMQKNLVPRMGCGIYFVDEETIEKCREYYSVHASGTTTFYKMLEGYQCVEFGYQNWNINKTLEDYKKMRMGMEEE